MSSPAESYARARRRNSHRELAEFTDQLDFALDPFQIEACEALEGGHGVLVCAPTGAGKTIVGEFAVHLALAEGSSCAYTTPIKALSNQKYADLVRRYGPEQVGLLTGDNSINPSAPILVMTTEVLRNMLYVGSETIDRLRYVVMDEVHYLADRFRGAVWEEVIIHLPEQVRLVSLSATVSNSEEFGQWLQSVRGDTAVIVSDERPVPLWQHMLVGKRLYDLLAEHGGDESQTRRREVNPELVRASREQLQRLGGWRGDRHRWRPTRRTDVVTTLDRQGLLPAIYFIFSRAGCDAAVEQCRAHGDRLLEPEDRALVREIAERHTAELSASDLDVLGYWEWLDALEMGYAAHHAGLIPAFKETVEELFVRGLCKVVFATETLALGINMPARSVVLERLVKFNGETHQRLTPGEYTQLTGRAGRRGIDIEGHAVTLWSPDVNPTEVATLATTRTFRLRSSFEPTYNMAVNLVGQIGRAASKRLLERSFAQFQADRSVVGLVRQRDEALAETRQDLTEVHCERGDVREYAELRRELTALERDSSKTRSDIARREVATSLARLRRGAIVHVPSGKHRGYAVVLDSRAEQGETVLRVLNTQRWSGKVDGRAFHGWVEPVETLKVPKNFNPRAPQARRDLAAELARRTAGMSPGRRRPRERGPDTSRIDELRERLRSHPVHSCPDRDEHVREFENARAAERKAAKLEAKVAARTSSLGHTFEAIFGVLVELGYLDPSGEPGSVTEAGALLSRLWSESDLLVAEAVRSDAWSELTAADLAAVVSALVYEPRGGDGFDTVNVPVGSRRVRTALGDLTARWRALNEVTASHGAPAIRQPEPGFALAAYRWVSGDSLGAVLSNLTQAGFEISPGDFVRWCRQVIDLLEQIGRLDTAIATLAQSAAASMRRGVLADPTERQLIDEAYDEASETDSGKVHTT
ncbi:DEAD/DEAH box helicase [Epidermidibacterium keratini]|uniref:DEAD/DEAH box helicase n=1 Tax=Epidermidibacterium keratini TaxID=1891644 RepID=A0A7L4YSL6_9ACTN|nr:DEAD/DEAH box helicase [Epidermidibacterium keratini]QHC02048.1 DEAD/DEAH box helicase [Epidermidibacterium keratini]